MMKSIRYWYQQLKAKKNDIRIHDMRTISKGSHVIIEQHARISDVQIDLQNMDTPLKIGAYTYLRSNTEINYVSSIGRFCSIGRNVILGQDPVNHPISWVSTSLSVSHQYKNTPKYTTIGNDVWIAHDAVIMAGVNIGHGAVIGRNAIVTKDVQPYQIVAGNPAKFIRYRFSPEKIEKLLNSQWWNVDYSFLRGLSFNDINLFMEELSTQKPLADYKKISVKNRNISQYK